MGFRRYALRRRLPSSPVEQGAVVAKAHRPVTPPGIQLANRGRASSSFTSQAKARLYPRDHGTTKTATASCTQTSSSKKIPEASLAARLANWEREAWTAGRRRGGQRPSNFSVVRSALVTLTGRRTGRSTVYPRVFPSTTSSRSEDPLLVPDRARRRVRRTCRSRWPLHMRPESTDTRRTSP